jgi:hypothetical protein
MLFLKVDKYDWQYNSMNYKYFFKYTEMVFYTLFTHFIIVFEPH